MQMTAIAKVVLGVFCSAALPYAGRAAGNPAWELEPGSHYAVTSRLHSVVAPRRVVDLCGAWEHRRVPLPGYEKRNSGGGWKKVKVPWQVKLNNEVRTREDYRRTLELPDPGEDLVIWHFDGLPGRAVIYVNDGLVATNWYSVGIDYDITRFVKKGRNDLRVELSEFGVRRTDVRPGDPGYVYSNRFGLNRPLWIVYRNRLGIADATVRTFVEPEKKLVSLVTLTNGTDAAQEVALSVSVPDGTVRRTARLLPSEARQVVVTNAWPHAVLWTPDAPNLQMVDYALDRAGRRMDATRVRVGFREIRTAGDRILLNGRPIMVRRVHPGSGVLPDDVRQRSWVRHLKDEGLNGLRVENVLLSRWVDVADEEGLLLSTFPECNARCRSAPPVWWENKRALDRQVCAAYRNRPSVICWGISNEFGGFYGLGGTNDEACVRLHQDLGRRFEEMDPTRPWTAYGDSEVGWPVRGPGPSPIRSFHYPKPPTGDRDCLPEMAWWYARHELSWQGISDATKPLSISEDLMHGLHDHFPGMTKWGGDSVFSREGYWKAWHDCVRMYADGYYDAGIACWDVWSTFDACPTNRVFEQVGPMTVETLIALRETFPNVRSGAVERRRLAVHNRAFSDQSGRLVRTLSVEGRAPEVFERELTVPAGDDWRTTEILAFPSVGRPTACRLSYAFVGAARTFAERTYSFTVFPDEKVSVPSDMAVVASSADVAGWSVGRTAETVAAATNSAAPLVIVRRRLTADEGRALRAYVRRGGRVMLLEAHPDGWVPSRLEKNKVQAFAWRRNDSALEGVTDGMLRIWRPDATLGDSGYAKVARSASEILVDTGHAAGLTQSQVLRIHEGEGEWFLVQLPLASRLGKEACVPHVLNAVLAEFAKPGVRKAKSLSCAPGKIGAYCERNGFSVVPFDRSGDPSRQVLACSAADLRQSKGEGFRSFVRRGGTGLVLDAGVGESGTLAEFGVVATDASKVAWTVRTDNAGLMAGLSNEDLFFANLQPHPFWRSDAEGRFEEVGEGRKRLATGPMLKAALSLKPGAAGRLSTDPGMIAEVPYGKGRIVFVSLDLAKAESFFPVKTENLLRTLVLNLGANSVPLSRETYFLPVDIARYVNRGLWKDPKRPDAPYWFGEENDMRYFPVNLCGWSPDSNNYCPVGVFPETPGNYGGLPFRIPSVKPRGETPYGGAVVLDPGEKTRIGFWNYRIAAFHFLGAAMRAEPASAANERPQPLLTAVWRGVYGGKTNHSSRAEFFCGDHLNGYRWAQRVKSGRVAWTGPSKLDRDSVLYAWQAENPLHRHDLISELELENTGKVPVALVGVTAEIWQ